MTLRERWTVLAGLIALYATSRLVGIDALPAFIDENWHMSWAHDLAEARRLFRPWQSGKWLSVFANAQILPWVEGSALVASRLLTAAFGAVTLLATWGLARRLYDERTAVVAGLFYVLCPFTLFYDRVVLTDPVMSTFSALTLLASVRLAQTGRARHGVLAGLALAAAVLTKALGAMLFFVPAAAWLAFARPLRRGVGALALAYAVSVGLAAWPLRSFFAVSGAVRQAVGGNGLDPLAQLTRNWTLVEEWLVGWFTLPLVVLVLAGTVWAVVRRQPPGLFLASVWVLPLAVLLPTATHWYPRYLLFLAVPSLILAARVLTGFTSWVETRLGLTRHPWTLALPAVATTLVLAPSMQVNPYLWVEPSRAPLPAMDRVQFIYGWPSGYGVRETVDLIAHELERHPGGITLVMNTRSRPTTRFALNVTFRGEPRLDRRDLPLHDPRALPLLEKWARERLTLLVVSPMRGGQARPSSEGWAHLGGDLALETRKPNGDLCDQVYRLAEPRGGPPPI